MRQVLGDYTKARCDVNGLAWSPDGALLATAHQDGSVRLWDGEGAAPVREIRAHSGWSRGVAWSPDGQVLATTGEDKRIVLWDPRSGQRLGEERHNYQPVWSVVWSPDGRLVSSGSGTYSDARVGVAIVWSVPR